MRKSILISLCLCLLLVSLAAAAAATGAGSAGGSIEIVINGRRTPLAFDGSEEYSTIADGTVQASFYAYSDNSTYLYELYMIFPDSVQSGSTITPDFALQNDPDCSVVLIISTNEDEQYYFAGQVDGAVYPNDSSYSISFDTVSADGDTRTYTGRLSASLVEMEMHPGAPLASFSIEDAPFSFSMSAAAVPGRDNPDPFGDFTPGFPDDPFAHPQPTPKPSAAKDSWRI